MDTEARLNETSYTAVAQEALVAIRDTIRCYPGYFEKAIVPVLSAVQNVDDPDARAALFYIIGEHAGIIENAYDLLKSFSTVFTDETEQVQLALLTAVVKVFLTCPTEDTQALTQEVLTQATSLGAGKAKSCSPDVRERGYFYWRLLSLDSLDTAKKVVFGANVGYDREKAVKIVDAYAAFNQFCPNLGAYSCVSRQAIRKVEITAEASDDADDEIIIEDNNQQPQPEQSAQQQQQEVQPAPQPKPVLDYTNVVPGMQAQQQNVIPQQQQQAQPEAQPDSAQKQYDPLDDLLGL